MLLDSFSFKIPWKIFKDLLQKSHFFDFFDCFILSNYFIDNDPSFSWRCKNRSSAINSCSDSFAYEFHLQMICVKFGTHLQMRSICMWGVTCALLCDLSMRAPHLIGLQGDALPALWGGSQGVDEGCL